MIGSTRPNPKIYIYIYIYIKLKPKGLNSKPNLQSCRVSDRSPSLSLTLQNPIITSLVKEISLPLLCVLGGSGRHPPLLSASFSSREMPPSFLSWEMVVVILNFYLNPFALSTKFICSLHYLSPLKPFLSLCLISTSKLKFYIKLKKSTSLSLSLSLFDYSLFWFFLSFSFSHIQNFSSSPLTTSLHSIFLSFSLSQPAKIQTLSQNTNLSYLVSHKEFDLHSILSCFFVLFHSRARSFSL